jgi:hypothetical protein
VEGTAQSSRGRVTGVKKFAPQRREERKEEKKEEKILL